MMQVLTIFVLSVLCLVNSQKTTYRGAVFEHNVFSPTNGKILVNRSVALTYIRRNLDVFEEQARIAGRQKVDILVFPEYGIYGIPKEFFNRKGMEPYLEYIPDPEKEEWNACEDQYKYNNSEIQHSLSCMARNNNLYIVANMGDNQPCKKGSDSSCPSDNHYQFNTLVVYNSSGYLISKYHKINLFYEKNYDFPPIEKSVSFTTPFGKFGTMICFDVLFKSPAIELVKSHGVRNIVFPTAWMDALPILAGIQFHSAFAAGNNVNFLAANIQYPERRFHGSGIYSPSGYLNYTYRHENKGKLLISDIPILWDDVHRKGQDKETIKRSDPLLKTDDVFQASVFRDTYNFRQLKNKNGHSTVCHGNLCCTLTYEKENNTETFAFGAFDGLHTYEGTYYIQVCILLKCANETLQTCGEPVINSSTYFKRVKIHGTFTTDYIYPEILLSDTKSLLHLASPSTWNYTDGVIESKSAFDYPLISIAMFARAYENDKHTNDAFANRPNLFIFVITILTAENYFVTKT